MTSKKKASPKGSRTQRRSAARLAAVQALYEMDVTGAPPDPVLRAFIQDRWQAGADDEVEEGTAFAEPDGELLTDLVRGVNDRRAELDGMLDPAMIEGRTVETLQGVMRALLRAGAYELLVRNDIPVRVVISEYMEVAKAFFTGPEPSLVNGVLDRLAKVLRAQEFETKPETAPEDGSDAEKG